MKPRAIVIEDDNASRALVTMLLEQKGYEVLSFSDPTACPVYTDPETPCPHEDACGDFLLTDNQMPNMTGLDFVESQCRRGCKGMVSNKAIFSGTWNAGELGKAEELGCKVFRKPYDLKEVSDWLDEQLKTVPPDRKLVVFDQS